MNKLEWTMTPSEFKEAEMLGIADYGNHKMNGKKRVSLYQCKNESIERAARNKMLKYLASDCTIHPLLELTNKFHKRYYCANCLEEIMKYMKEGK